MGRARIAHGAVQPADEEFVAEGAAFCSLFTGAQNHAQKIYQRAGLRVTSHWAVLSQSLGQGERCQEAYF